MEKYRINYEKSGKKDFVYLYSESKEEAEHKFADSFGTLGYEMKNIEPTGYHLTEEQVYSK